VHVWRADLDAVDDDDLLELLSREEHARGEGILRDGARRRWLRARGALRALLGRYTESDPRAIRFIEGSYGKPALPPKLSGASAPCAGSRSARAGLPSFNLSHSGGLALYAFTQERAVGIDV